MSTDNPKPCTDYTYSSTQATNCAGCGKHKHTPLRVDKMGGYVCLTCIDKKLSEVAAAPQASETHTPLEQAMEADFQQHAIDFHALSALELELIEMFETKLANIPHCDLSVEHRAIQGLMELLDAGRNRVHVAEEKLAASESGAAALREAAVECDSAFCKFDPDPDSRYGMAWAKVTAALATDAGAATLKELQSAIHERESCHALFDQVLALCGYGKGQGYPGIVGAVEKLKTERDDARAKLAEVEKSNQVLNVSGAELATRLADTEGKLAEAQNTMATLEARHLIDRKDVEDMRREKAEAVRERDEARKWQKALDEDVCSQRNDITELQQKVRVLTKQLTAARALADRLGEVLGRVSRWELPSGDSYGPAFERDHIRSIADAAIAAWKEEK